MKDLITSISGLIALLVFVFCMFTGVNFEAAMWKAIVIFVATNLIGYAAYGLVSVTMQSMNETEELGNDDVDSFETENAESEQPAMNV